MWYETPFAAAPVLSALPAAAVFAILACMAGWLATRPLHAMGLISGLVLINAFGLSLSLNAGIWIYPEDIVFIGLGLACMVRFALFCRPAVVPKAWWIIGAAQALLAAWGISSYGTPAGVDARGHAYLWIAVLYCCSVRWDDDVLDRLLGIWIGCSLALCSLVAWRWIWCMLDPAYEQAIMALDSTGVRFRVVSSGVAFTIACGALALLYRMLNGKPMALGWAMLAWQLFTVLLLQHRSVWVSVFIGVLCLAWAGRAKTSTPRLLAALAMLALPLAILAALPSDDGMLASVKQSADNAMSTTDGTMVGRVLNWEDLLDKWIASRDPVVWLLGHPYGSGYNPDVLWDGTDVDMVPHNHFVHILYRGGLIALAATLWLFWRVWRSVLAATRGVGVERTWAPFFLAALSALYAYCIPYWATYDSGILLGIAMSRFGLAGKAAVPVFRPARTQGFAVQPLRVPRFSGERK